MYDTVVYEITCLNSFLWDIIGILIAIPIVCFLITGFVLSIVGLIISIVALFKGLFK